jgi:hypothetical protein
MSTVAEFSAKVDAWLKGVNELTVGVARGLSVEVFNIVLSKSAQYSGDFASNWKYSVGAPNYSFEESHLMGKGEYGRGFTPFIEGHPIAMAKAQSLNAGADLQFTKLGQTIYISNSAHHDDAYAWEIEKGTAGRIKFRQGNQGKPLSRTLDAMTLKYGTGIGTFEATRLAERHIGV